MTDAELGKLSILALAHVGDAVYELLVRTLLAERGVATALQLHRETVARVKAPAQAKAAAVILPHLTEAAAGCGKCGAAGGWRRYPARWHPRRSSLRQSR